MSELSGRYKKIMEELENNIHDKSTLRIVKEKFSDLSMMFIDIIDRITEITDARIKVIEDRQQEIADRIMDIQTTVDGIENDIYEEDEDASYEFEIVCPYCNFEFTADIEEENKEEIQCPECHNLIELDWNYGEEECGLGCSHCPSQGGCMAAEDEEEYDSSKKNNNKEDIQNDNNEEDEDM